MAGRRGTVVGARHGWGRVFGAAEAVDGGGCGCGQGVIPFCFPSVAGGRCHTVAHLNATIVQGTQPAARVDASLIHLSLDVSLVHLRPTLHGAGGAAGCRRSTHPLAPL